MWRRGGSTTVGYFQASRSSPTCPFESTICGRSEQSTRPLPKSWGSRYARSQQLTSAKTRCLRRCVRPSNVVRYHTAVSGSTTGHNGLLLRSGCAARMSRRCVSRVSWCQRYARCAVLFKLRHGCTGIGRAAGGCCSSHAARPALPAPSPREHGHTTGSVNSPAASGNRMRRVVCSTVGRASAASVPGCSGSALYYWKIRRGLVSATIPRSVPRDE